MGAKGEQHPAMDRRIIRALVLHRERRVSLADGSLAPADGYVQHAGSSINPSRQKEPHAHSINTDRKGKRAYACDLGLDMVLIYKVVDNKLVPSDPASASTPRGGGPRHLSFSPDNKFAYVCNELTSSVSVFGSRSFGMRPFVEALPVLAVGLAALVSAAASVRARRLVLVGAAATSLLALHAMIAYWTRAIPFDGTTFPTYVKSFWEL